MAEEDLTVIVVDSRRQFLERVPPAVARYALKNQFANVLYKSPFSIQLLAPDLRKCPRPPSKRDDGEPAKTMPEVIRVHREKQMKANFNPAQSMQDAESVLEKIDRKNGGDGIVWVCSNVKDGSQFILSLKDRTNRDIIGLPALKAGIPFCLSSKVSFEDLRTSPGLVEATSKGLVKLMTSTDAHAHFEKKAASKKLSADELMRQTDSAYRDQVAQSKSRLAPNAVDSSMRVRNEFVSVEDVIHPRVQNLMNAVGPTVKDHERMSESELMEELGSIEDVLDNDNLTYIQAYGYYPQVKKWAMKKMNEINAIPEEEEAAV